jgi:hypothetical protein
MIAGDDIIGDARSSDRQAVGLAPPRPSRRWQAPSVALESPHLIDVISIVVFVGTACRVLNVGHASFVK